ncbi:MAG: tRNA (adenosine(37)-N6)-dimethylallyltransferase MiaA [Methylacidiphilales bacterium]|nr:tRNA (adenosine(37)-N6)-dimethylallyltransferase MiaA [Candidatus Methylacidiphilales bacterium]
MNKLTLFSLSGPTCSGKSALAITLAKEYNFELISVDSGMVYKGMDIGTDKPTLQERSEVTHHLIDIIEPHQSYSAARFCNDVYSLCDEISQRGNRALMVGGTLMYVQSLLSGWFVNPIKPITIYPFVFVPFTKKELDSRIETRFNQMLEKGLVAESECLLKTHSLTNHCPAFRVVGYRQVFEYLQGKYSYQLMRSNAIIATRHLAKKQFTWIRNYFFGQVCVFPQAIFQAIASIKK